MDKRTIGITGVLVSMALLAIASANAGTLAPTPELKLAFAKADQGPDQLRWFVQRTKTIYALDYTDVLQKKAELELAAADGAVITAQATTR